MQHRSRKVFNFGERYYSQTEANRYLCLRNLLEEGVISELKVHPRFEITPRRVLDANAFRKRTGISRETYTADFMYTYADIRIVEDVKGSYSNPHKKTYRKPIVTAASRKAHKRFMVKFPHIVFKIVCDYEITKHPHQYAKEVAA